VNGDTTEALFHDFVVEAATIHLYFTLIHIVVFCAENHGFNVVQDDAADGVC
jgi:hypothetical protein